MERNPKTTKNNKSLYSQCYFKVISGYVFISLNHKIPIWKLKDNARLDNNANFFEHEEASPCGHWEINLGHICSGEL